MTASNFISTGSAIFDQDTGSYRLMLPEGAGAGTVVGSVGRSGRDGTVAYSLRGRDSGLLQIDSAGQITLVGELPSDATELQVDIVASITRSGTGGADRQGQSDQSAQDQSAQGEPETLTATGSRIIVMADDDLPLVQVRPRDGAVPENENMALVATYTILHPNHREVFTILHGEHGGLLGVRLGTANGNQIFATGGSVSGDGDGLNYEAHGSNLSVTMTFLTGLPSFVRGGGGVYSGSSQLRDFSRWAGPDSRLDVPLTVLIGDVDEPPVFLRQVPVPGWPTDQPLPDLLQRMESYSRIEVELDRTTGVVATLDATDPDAGTTIRYELTSHRDKFEIVGNSLRLRSDAEQHGRLAGVFEVTVDAVSQTGGNPPKKTTLTVQVDAGVANGPPNSIIDLSAVKTIPGYRADPEGLMQTATRVDDDDSYSFRLAPNVDRVMLADHTTSDGTIGLFLVAIDSTQEGRVFGEIGKAVHYAFIEGRSVARHNLQFVGLENDVEFHHWMVEREFSEAERAAYEAGIFFERHHYGTDLPNFFVNQGIGNDIFHGGAGDDFVLDSYGNDALLGGAGNDTLFGSHDSDILEGGPGRDRLYGGGDNDGLIGGSGRDHLDGGSGRDILTGGIGRDRFHLKDLQQTVETADRITDFGFGGKWDKIVLEESVTQVWFRHQDVDGDGVQDTILFNRDGNGQMAGIYAIIEDFSTDLTSQNFENDSIVVTEVI